MNPRSHLWVGPFLFKKVIRIVRETGDINAVIWNLTVIVGRLTNNPDKKFDTFIHAPYQ